MSSFVGGVARRSAISAAAVPLALAALMTFGGGRCQGELHSQPFRGDR